MSRAPVVLISVCALAVNFASSHPALAPISQSTIRETNAPPRMIEEKTSIFVRRIIPDTFVFPPSLWPLPEYSLRDLLGETGEEFYQRRRSQRMKKTHGIR